MLFRLIFFILITSFSGHLSAMTKGCPPAKILDELTTDYYERNSKTYAKNFENHNADDQVFNYFLRALDGPKQEVLDIGTGSGRFVGRLLDEGHNVTGIDPAETLLKTAKKNHPQGTFINMDARDLEFPDESFDATIAPYSFIHFNKKDLDRAVGEAARVTREEGTIFIALQKGTGKETKIKMIKGLDGSKLPVLKILQRDAEDLLVKHDIIIDDVSSRPARLDLNELNPDKLYFIGRKARDPETKLKILDESAQDLDKEIRRIVLDSGKEDFGTIKFPEEVRWKQNRNMKAFLKMLQDSGVEARYNLTRTHPEFLEIEILGVSENAPEPFKKYYQRYRDLIGTELVISPFDNTIRASRSRFWEPTNTVDIGIEALIDGLRGKENANAFHELDHLELTKRQKKQTDQFAVKFFEGKNESLEVESTTRKPADGFYSQYENAQEVYTFSKELEFFGNELKAAKTPKEKITLVNKIKLEMNGFNQIMQNTTNLSQKTSKITDGELVKITDTDRYRYVRQKVNKDGKRVGPAVALDLTDNELKVYNSVKEEDLLALLNPKQTAKYKAKRDQLKERPFFARTKIEHIRATLLDMIDEKMTNHLNELRFTSQSQAKLGAEINTTLNSNSLDTKKLANLLIKAGKSVEY